MAAALVARIDAAHMRDVRGMVARINRQGIQAWQPLAWLGWAANPSRNLAATGKNPTGCQAQADRRFLWRTMRVAQWIWPPLGSSRSIASMPPRSASRSLPRSHRTEPRLATLPDRAYHHSRADPAGTFIEHGQSGHIDLARLLSAAADDIRMHFTEGMVKPSQQDEAMRGRNPGEILRVFNRHWTAS